jgi:hypothetical protein
VGIKPSTANSHLHHHYLLTSFHPSRVRARRGVVVAAGVWSGQLLAGATGQPAWQQLLQPRRGHLLEIPLPDGMPPVHTGQCAGSTHRVPHQASMTLNAHGLQSRNLHYVLLAWHHCTRAEAQHRGVRLSPAAPVTCRDLACSTWEHTHTCTLIGGIIIPGVVVCPLL